MSETRSAGTRSVFLVVWDAAAVGTVAPLLRDAGWEVWTESEDGGRAYRGIREHAPACLVVDLSRRPSHGREVVRSLRATRSGRALPVVYSGGDSSSTEFDQGPAEQIESLRPELILAALERLEQDRR